MHLKNTRVKIAWILGSKSNAFNSFMYSVQYISNASKCGWGQVCLTWVYKGGCDWCKLMRTSTVNTNKQDQGTTSSNIDSDWQHWLAGMNCIQVQCRDWTNFKCKENKDFEIFQVPLNSTLYSFSLQSKFQKVKM